MILFANNTIILLNTTIYYILNTIIVTVGGYFITLLQYLGLQITVGDKLDANKQERKRQEREKYKLKQ